MNQEYTRINAIDQIGSIPIFQSYGYSRTAKLSLEHDLQLMSTRAFCVARSLESSNPDLVRRGSFVKERMLYIPKRIAGKDYSIIMRSDIGLKPFPEIIEKVTDDFALLLLEEALNDQDNYLILENDSPVEVSSKSFGLDPKAKFFFNEEGNIAIELLGQMNIAFMPFNLYAMPSACKSQNSFSTAIYFGGLNESFVITRADESSLEKNCYVFSKSALMNSPEFKKAKTLEEKYAVKKLFDQKNFDPLNLARPDYLIAKINLVLNSSSDKN